MKKKLLLVLMALALCIASMPMTFVQAAKTTTTTTTTTTTGVDDDEDDFDYEDEGSDDEDVTGEMTKDDLVVTPAKKTVKVGKSFYINIMAADDSEWEDLPDEEWEELCENNIDSISFRSTKSSVASVNKVTGRVKAKKKCNAVIKTTINLVNGESVTFKTKVYVTR